MKVVLFCGGLGMRMRDYSEQVPKPMINVEGKPILWNIMRYYAHFGHKDFILCLGYKGDFIKQYFEEERKNALTRGIASNGTNGTDRVEQSPLDWNITFVETGLTSNIGQRLLRVRSYLDEDEYFMANYADGLTDMPLNDMVEWFKETNKTGSFLAYRPTQSFHVVRLNNDGMVNTISPISNSGFLINAGYFIFKNEIFDYIKEGEELVTEPFQRLIRLGQLYGYQYKGFWMPLDTFKDKQQVDTMCDKGMTPWKVWKHEAVEMTRTA